MPTTSTLPVETVDSEHFSPYRQDGKLYGFVCIVTGSTWPIGRAIVLELAFHGAACVYACSSSTEDDYMGLVEEIEELYPNTKVIPYPYKHVDEQETLTLLDDVLNSWGRLDVWVCSSGLLGPPSIDDTTPDDLIRCFEANSMAPFFALKYAPPAMAKTTPKGNYPNAAPKDQKYGSIVVIGSVASESGGCWGPCFTMSSHASLGVVRSGVAVLKGTGVRINLISAGQIEAGIDLKQVIESGPISKYGADRDRTQTDVRGGNSQLPPSALQSPETHKKYIGLERPGLPTEVGRVAGFLASGFSSYITGANLVVDGGATTMNPLTLPL